MALGLLSCELAYSVQVGPGGCVGSAEWMRLNSVQLAEPSDDGERQGSNRGLFNNWDRAWIIV